MSEAEVANSGEASVAAVSIEEVRHVADLANLELTVDELPHFAKDLNAILGYIAQLNELDTSDVPPMAQVSDILSTQKPVEMGQQEAFGRSLRADAVKPSVDRTLVMAEAPETDGRFFKVPKVIER